MQGSQIPGNGVVRDCGSAGGAGAVAAGNPGGRPMSLASQLPARMHNKPDYMQTLDLLCQFPSLTVDEAETWSSENGSEYVVPDLPAITELRKKERRLNAPKVFRIARRRRNDHREPRFRGPAELDAERGARCERPLARSSGAPFCEAR